MMSDQLLVLMTLPFIAILGIVAVARSAWAIGAVRNGPSCGGCGYEISHASFTCPECGGALTKVGIVTPRGMIATRGSMLMLVCGWIALFPLILLPVTWTVRQVENIVSPPAPYVPPTPINWEWDWIRYFTITPRADDSGDASTPRSSLFEFRLAINTNDDNFRKPIEGLATLEGVSRGKTVFFLTVQHPGTAFTVDDAEGKPLFTGDDRTSPELASRLMNLLIPETERGAADAEVQEDLAILLAGMFNEEPANLVTLFRGSSHVLQVTPGNDSQFQAVPGATGKLPLTLTPTTVPPTPAPIPNRASIGYTPLVSIVTSTIFFVGGLIWLVPRRLRMLREASVPAQSRAR